MEAKIVGLHHVTAIASDPQRNLDFYAGVLGLRFVKRTVNFDDQPPIQEAIDHLERVRTQLLSKMFDLGKAAQ